jgi:hypothetical protein
MPTGKPVMISVSAVEARVRRAIARDSGDKLVKSRSAAARQGFGEYYTIDPHSGKPERWPLDIESLAAEFRVLRPWEAMES